MTPLPSSLLPFPLSLPPFLFISIPHSVFFTHSQPFLNGYPFIYIYSHRVCVLLLNMGFWFTWMLLCSVDLILFFFLYSTLVLIFLCAFVHTCLLILTVVYYSTLNLCVSLCGIPGLLPMSHHQKQGYQEYYHAYSYRLVWECLWNTPRS